MAYFTPYIDNQGIHVPTYEDILDYFKTSAQGIFGTDIYLEEDSQDYELISILARAAAGSMQAAVDSYNARDPDTAFDDVLDGLISINGIKRKSSSKSTVTLLLTGLPYTVITNGVVKSASDTKWDLPSRVVLGADGTATVTAVAEDEGAIIALANEINQIVTPTYGWSTVNNPSAAEVGQPVESTPDLKSRRKIAVATPSQTPLESLAAGIDNLLGVTDFQVYENDTKEVDSRGFPPNSIVAVVDGGKDEEICETISKYKNMGVLSYGDVTLPITNEYGSILDISFFRPEEVTVYMTINLVALDGYTSGVATQIKEAIIKYFSDIYIGDNLYNSQLWEAVLSVSPDVRPYFYIDPTKGILVGTEQGDQSIKNLIATFKQKFITSEDNISIILGS